jgi:hypothetical protein
MKTAMDPTNDELIEFLSKSSTIGMEVEATCEAVLLPVMAAMRDRMENPDLPQAMRLEAARLFGEGKAIQDMMQRQLALIDAEKDAFNAEILKSLTA